MVTVDDINSEIIKLNDQMIKQFGEPPKQRGIMPTIEQLINMWIFY